MFFKALRVAFRVMLQMLQYPMTRKSPPLYHGLGPYMLRTDRFNNGTTLRDILSVGVTLTSKRRTYYSWRKIKKFELIFEFIERRSLDEF